MSSSSFLQKNNPFIQFIRNLLNKLVDKYFEFGYKEDFNAILKCSLPLVK